MNGYVVASAPSVASALLFLEEGSFDCAILNLETEGNGGREILYNLRVCRARPPALVIAFTSSFEAESFELLSGKRVIVLHKPLEFGFLLDVIGKGLM